MSLKFIVYEVQKNYMYCTMYCFFFYQNDGQNAHILNTTGGFRWFFVNTACALLCIDVLLLFWNGLKTQSSDQSVVKKKKGERNEESLHFIQTSFLCENFNLKDLNKLKKSLQKTYSYLYHLPLKRKYTQFIERRSNWIKKKTMHKLLSSHWIM